jgi:hypothetical protein
MWQPDAHADLAELLELHKLLPEAARQRADQLVERLAIAEVRRVEHEAVRLQRSVAARTLPAERRARELAAVFEQMAGAPTLSARENRRRLAKGTGWPARRIRQYQELLSHFTIKGPPTKAAQAREALAANGRVYFREGATGQRHVEYSGDDEELADVTQ